MTELWLVLLAACFALACRDWMRFLSWEQQKLIEGMTISVNGEARVIMNYDGVTATVDQPWPRAPTSADRFEIR